MFFSHVNVCLFITSIGLSYGCHRHHRLCRCCCSRQKRDCIYVIAVNFLFTLFSIIIYVSERQTFSDVVTAIETNDIFSQSVNETFLWMEANKWR